MEEKILELIGVVDELNGCIKNILNTQPPYCDLIGRDETGHEYHIRSYSIDRAWILLRHNYINFSAHFNDISNVTDVALLYGNIKKYLKLGVKPWDDDNQVYSSCEKWWKVFEYNNFQTLELSMEQQAKGEPQPEQANSGQITDAQSFNPEPEQAASTIPTLYDTDKEKLVFGNAIEKKYISLKGGSYKWNLPKSLAGLMCGMLYCGDRIKEDESDYGKEYKKGKNQMPAKEIKELFGFDVAANRHNLKALPRNSWKVEELFKNKNKGASK